MIFKNHKIQKVVSAFMIIAVLAPSVAIFSVPKRTVASGWPVVDVVGNILRGIGVISAGTTAAGTTVNTAISVKNVLKEIARQLMMAIAKRALAAMTKSTVNWINNGFHGSPLFIDNPQSFFKDITKFEIKDLISVIGYDPNRFPFGKQFALNTIDNYKRTLQDNATYSLSKVTNDPTLLYNYRSNFSYGGLNGFLLNTQYPQNNFIGSQILLNNELARRLNVDDINTSAGKIQDTLQKGQGFLSPQTCPSNPSYNNLSNQFQKPVFQYKQDASIIPPVATSWYDAADANSQYNKDLADYKYMLASDKEAQQETWAKTNVCKGGLVNTTPGSVVASSIMKSLSSGQELTQLQAALGGSLSAIFDALLNKFLGSGLNALASSTNSQPYNADTWDYMGNTLGSPSTGLNGNADPFNGPDQEVVLDKFKTDVNQGILDTQTEFALMDNKNPNNYGVAQMIALLWPKTRELDICTPGPNLGWETRLADEMQRNAQTIQGRLSQDSNTVDDVYQINLASKNLQFAVNFFKDWIRDQMMTPVSQGGFGLPSSSMFLDAVQSVTALDQESTDLIKNKRSKQETLIRLASIKRSLGFITIQPAPGSQGEKDLISLKKQYDAVSIYISNAISIEETRNELETTKEKYGNLSKLLADCNKERQTEKWSSMPATGWTKSGGENSTLLSAVGKSFTKMSYFGQNRRNLNPSRTIIIPYTTTGNEKEQFCELPIIGGYTHETFVNPKDPTQEGRNVPYPTIPLVNAGALSGRDARGNGAFGPLQDTNINLSCNIIYQSNILDYKGEAAGTTTVTEPPHLPDVDTSAPTYDPGTNTSTGTGGTNNPGTSNPPSTGGTGTNPPPTNPPDDCGVSVPCG